MQRNLENDEHQRLSRRELVKEKSKWVARIVKDRKQHVLGYFASKEEAYYAYLKAARELHKEFAKP